jgi:hypothetical protein
MGRVQHRDVLSGAKVDLAEDLRAPPSQKLKVAPGELESHYETFYRQQLLINVKGGQE